MASLLSYPSTSDGKLTCVMKTIDIGPEASMFGSAGTEGVVGGNLAVNGVCGLIPANALPPASLFLTKSCTCVGYKVSPELKEKLTFEACSKCAGDAFPASLREQSARLGPPCPSNSHGDSSEEWMSPSSLFPPTVLSLNERENGLPHSGGGVRREPQSKLAQMNYRRKKQPKGGSNVIKNLRNRVSLAPLCQLDMPPPVCTTTTTCTSSSPSPPAHPSSLSPGSVPVLAENGLSAVTTEVPFPTVDEIEKCISEDLSLYFQRICLFLARNRCNLVSLCV